MVKWTDSWYSVVFRLTSTWWHSAVKSTQSWWSSRVKSTNLWWPSIGIKWTAVFRSTSSWWHCGRHIHDEAQGSSLQTCDDRALGSSEQLCFQVNQFLMTLWSTHSWRSSRVTLTNLWWLRIGIKWTSWCYSSVFKSTSSWWHCGWHIHDEAQRSSLQTCNDRALGSSEQADDTALLSSQPVPGDTVVDPLMKSTNLWWLSTVVKLSLIHISEPTRRA